MATIHKASSITDLDVLHLRVDTLRSLNLSKVNAQELISAARNDSAWQTYLPECSTQKAANKLKSYRGIGENRAWDITDKVERAGFIFQDEGASLSIRRLYSAIKGNPDKLLENYEKLSVISDDDCNAITRVLAEKLTAEEKDIIEARFGLKDGYYRTYDTCSREFSTSPEDIKATCWLALAKLRHPDQLSTIESIACNLQPRPFPRLRSFVSKYFHTKRRLGAKPKERYIKGNPFDLSFEELGIPIQSCGLLRGAGIRTCSELVRAKDTDLMKIRNFSYQRLAEIKTVYSEIYC